MPLRKGDPRYIGRNIKEMMAAGHPYRQALAAALDAADIEPKKPKDGKPRVPKQSR